jgi:signal transduction histidine kinase
MKLIKLLCFCLLTNFAFGQPKLSPEAKKKLRAARVYAGKYNNGYFNVYKIDSIAREGILINRGWRVKYEDKSVFLKPDLDDSKWDTISIDQTFDVFPAIDKNRIGWFRKNIFVDSSMVDKPYILKTLITGAAEIYLNGKLIHEIGKVSLDAQKAKTKYFKMGSPYSITFKNPGQQSLAVRFLFTPHSTLDQDLDLFPLSLRIIKLEGVMQSQLSEEGRYKLMDGVCFGLFFMMAFIHFFFFYFFRTQKFNLSFSIAMFLFGVYFCVRRGSVFYEDFNNFVKLKITCAIIIMAAHIILMNAIYEYLKYQKKILFWSVVLLFFVANILVIFQIIDGKYKVLIYALLIVNYFFLIWISIKNKHSEGLVMRNAIFTFMAIFATYFVLIIVMSAFGQFAIDNYYADQTLLYSVGIPFAIIFLSVGPQLSVSGAISFSLAKEFVKTNISLSQKLVEIETLSNEKQHLLSTQNEYLEQQVNQRTAELNLSLENLKNTQTQLIQSEKLASLGELTAGIAHEIQNPLNFVNNFSELSVELIEEAPKPPEGADENWIPQEIPYGGWGAFFTDITQNLQKINLHGKRASSIVKGMLEHSRTSTGKKELTDINALADEYLRLSYHGLRAKNKQFNSDFKTALEENLPKIAVTSQDLGRVFLNLINNAFYAVGKRDNESKATGGNFRPMVIVSTENIDNQIVISIKDNGIGMADEVKAKIFQPFFTTKPTGQGTGLGLSLAYDIVTKGHGGTIECESVEGEGTTFVVRLPL